MLELYFAPDTCSLATLIALEDAQADYRLHRVNLDAGEQRSAAYLAINPKGRVPALVTPLGLLTETPAMLVYIAQSHPAAGLAPLDDPFAFAQLQSFNNYLVSTLHVAHAHRMRGHRWADDPQAIKAMQQKVPESVGASYGFIEEHAFVGPFVMGKSYTIADPYLFTIAQWMEADDLDPSRFPKVEAHREMMRERPSVQRAVKAESA